MAERVLIDDDREPTTAEPRHAQMSNGCADPTCDASLIGPTDLYCADHERFLPTVYWHPVRRFVAALAWRVAACWAFLLTVQAGTFLPAYVVGVAAGAALLLLPLRRLPLEWWGALVSWLLLSTLVPILFGNKPTDTRGITTVMVLVTVTVWTASFARFAMLLDRSLGRAAGSTFISGFGAGLASLVLFLLTNTPLAESVFFLDNSIDPLLLFLAAAAGAVCAVVVVIAAAFRAVDQHVPYPSIPKPAPFLTGEHRRGKVRRGGGPVSGVIDDFVLRVASAGNVFMRLVVHVLKLLWYWFLPVLVWAAACVSRWVRATVRIIDEGIRLLGYATRKATRVVAVPFACLLLGAWLVYLFAGEVLAYLRSGTAEALAAMLADGAGAAVTVTVAWIALAQQRLGQSIRSAGRTLSFAAANGLVLVAVGGWVVGLFGTLGDGPIQVGPVTIAATVLLIISSLWLSIRNRRNTS